MRGIKYSRKVQFFPYLPYGICSKLATTISGQDNPYCSEILMGDNADALLNLCVKHKNNATLRAKTACAQGYVVEKFYVCKDTTKPLCFRVLTGKGLTAFLEAVPGAVAADLEDEDGEKEGSHDGNIKETTHNELSKRAAERRNELHEYANSSVPTHQEIFRELLLQSVMEESCTPLTSGLALAEKVRINKAKYSLQQTYNIWRMSHINAMFMANDHLTYLDRRPYNTGFAIDGIVDEHSYESYIQKHGITMAAFTYRALNDWYNTNPDFYHIKQTEPTPEEEAYDEWLATPAFYSTKELPNFNDRQIAVIKGSQQKLNHTAVGLATGRHINYLCYHAKPGPFKWIIPRENRMKEEAQRSVRIMKTQNPQLPYNDRVDYALYFCSSHHQFLALFDKTKQKFQKGKETKHIMAEPFAGVYAIPVNDCGTFLLWCLLEESPLRINQSICNNLVRRGIGFEHRVDITFPLTYNGKRVFAGYSMDICSIHRALEEYLAGNEFYICCFSEQAKWYSLLFPGIKIL